MPAKAEQPKKRARLTRRWTFVAAVVGPSRDRTPTLFITFHSGRLSDRVIERACAVHQRAGRTIGDWALFRRDLGMAYVAGTGDMCRLTL